MSIESSNTLWTKAESATSLTAPETGGVGSIVGTISYESAKFNNGSRPVTTASGLQYTRATVTPNTNRYVIDHWVKWKKSSASWNTTEWFFGDRKFGVYHGLLFGILNNKQMRIVLKDAAGDDGWSSNAITFSSGDLDHFLIVLDKDASFDGAKTWALYRNDAELTSGTKVMNFTVPNPGYGFFAAFAAGAGVYQGSAINTIFDNIKAYDENAIPLIQDIIDNRNNEGWPVGVTTKNYYFNSAILKSKSLSVPLLKEGNFNTEIVKSMDLDTPIE